jgi:hypothetical protein
MKNKKRNQYMNSSNKMSISFSNHTPKIVLIALPITWGSVSSTEAISELSLLSTRPIKIS